MTTNQPYLQQLHYQITPEDYAALRDCLSARTVGESARSVHTMLPRPDARLLGARAVRSSGPVLAELLRW